MTCAQRYVFAIFSSFFVRVSFVLFSLIGMQPSCQAQASDYTTLERVLFVEQCASEQPQRPRQEMLFKCVCVFDQLATTMSYDDLITLQTAANATSIKGERGRIMRSQGVREQAHHFRRLLGEARAACLLPEPS